MVQAQTNADPQLLEIQEGLEVLFRHSTCIEIRALEVPDGKYTHKTVSGYFNDLEKAAREAWKLDRAGAKAIYVVGDVDPLLLAKAANRIEMRPHDATSKEHVTQRRWFLLDIDVPKPHINGKPVSAISASDEERQQAIDYAAEIDEFLRSKGFPEAICGTSGNGQILLYRIDLPANAETEDLLRRVLQGVNDNTSGVSGGGPCAKLDLQVGPPANQPIRVPGTTNRKGDQIEGRPHRRAAIYIPDELPPIVSRGQLEHVASLARPRAATSAAPASPPPTSPERNGHTRPRLDMLRYLAARGLKIKDTRVKGDVTFFYLDGCPFGEHHGDTQTAFTQHRDGRPGFDCKHCDCAGIKWQEASLRIGRPDGDHYDPPIKSKAAKPAPSNSQPSATREVVDNEQPAAIIPIPTIPSAVFANAAYAQRFLVEQLLVAEQPGIVGGRSKTMKTSLLIALALALGTGSRFLNEFWTVLSTVAFLSGESGAFTIQETARRIARTMGINLADAQVHWGFTLPQITRSPDLDALTAMIHITHADVTIIDPAYLTLLAGDTRGLQASNVFDMGPLLLQLSKVGEETGSTIILCHHCRKNMADPYEPPELEDLSMAGFAEWARQWWLLGRREKYNQSSGEHKLWLNSGGSAGFSGLWAVDVNEGVIDDNFRGRRWDVTVNRPDEARTEQERRREAKNAEKRDATRHERKMKIIKVLRQYGEQSATKIRERTGIRDSGTVADILLELKQCGEVTVRDGLSGRQHCDLYAIKT